MCQISLDGQCVKWSDNRPDREAPPLSKNGAKLYQVYNDLLNTQGWWNTDGDFTYDEFFGLLILLEGSGDFDAENVVALIASHQIYSGANPWRMAYCRSGHGCLNAAFNFWAAWSEIAKKAISGENPISKYFPPRHLSRAAELGRKMFHPGQYFDQEIGPYDGGVCNATMNCTQVVRDYLSGASIGTGEDQIWYKIGDTYYYSFRQKKYWEKKILEETKVTLHLP